MIYRYQMSQNTCVGFPRLPDGIKQYRQRDVKIHVVSNLQIVFGIYFIITIRVLNFSAGKGGGGADYSHLHESAQVLRDSVPCMYEEWQIVEIVALYLN
jgi:hypothetical protein